MWGESVGEFGEFWRSVKGVGEFKYVVCYSDGFCGFFESVEEGEEGEEEFIVIVVWFICEVFIVYEEFLKWVLNFVILSVDVV